MLLDVPDASPCRPSWLAGLHSGRPHALDAPRRLVNHAGVVSSGARGFDLERFTFASPTCSSQLRIHMLQIIGVFPSRVAATVPSLGASAPGYPRAIIALSCSKPQSGHEEGSASARTCRCEGS